jgi:hypothetical protein
LSNYSKDMMNFNGIYMRIVIFGEIHVQGIISIP